VGYKQEAQLSQRGRATLRVCRASIQNVERSLLLLVAAERGGGSYDLEGCSGERIDLQPEQILYNIYFAKKQVNQTGKSPSKLATILSANKQNEQKTEKKKLRYKCV